MHRGESRHILGYQTIVSTRYILSRCLLPGRPRDEGVGSGPNPMGYGDMPYSMVDTVQVPATLGRYMLSWRWDCEQVRQPSSVIDGWI